MKLTDDEVTRFRQIYRSAYGEDMPADEARTWVLRVVRLYRIVLRPTPAELAERFAKSRTVVTLDLPVANKSTQQ